MRQMKKLFLLLAMTMLVTLMTFGSASAASVPGGVSSLKAKVASESSIKLSWKKVKGAKGYNIYVIDTATGARSKLATARGSSYTFKKVIPERTYSFQVFAYNKAGESQVGSNVVSAATTVKTPSTPSGLKVVSRQSNGVKLKWNKAKNANGYYVSVKNPSTGQYERVMSSKSNSCTLTGISSTTLSDIIVTAYRSVNGVVKTSGGSSNNVTSSAVVLSAQASTVHGRYWHATAKRAATATVIGTGQNVVINKGTRLIAESATSGTVVVHLSNGARATMTGSALSYGNIYVTSNEYSTATKEAFVNEKGYSSPTPYLIWISQFTTNTNVFRGSRGNWKLVKSIPCIVGKQGKTGPGVFHILKYDYAHGARRTFFTWSSKLNNGNAFHNFVDGNRRGAYSLGCVRMSAANANWIAANCRIGTTVVSY